MNAKDVIITALEAHAGAEHRGFSDPSPASRCSLANSMMRMAFLAANAIRTTRPICA